MTVNFPSDTLCDINALQQYLKRATGDIIINVQQNIYGELKLQNLICSSLQIIGNGLCWSGATAVAVEMRLKKENLLSGVLPILCDVDRLKLNGENMIQARYPSHDSCAMADINRRADSWNIENVKVKALHEREWGGNSYTMSKINGKVKLDWIGNNNRGSGYKDGTLVVENVYEELNSNKEWYYNKKSNKIYLHLEDAKSGIYNFELIHNLNLLTVTACSNTKITVSGFVFCDTASSMFNHPWERYLRSDWAFNKSSAITLDGSSDINIFDCEFKNLGNNAIGIYNKCSDINIKDSCFKDCLSGGVLILGDKESTYCTSAWDNNNHIAEIENPTKIGVKSDNYPTKIGVTCCYFNNLGIEDKQCAAVCISLSSYVTVANCTICHMPRAGVNIAENSFGGHVISGNDIFDCVKETGDHGPFNSWGRDRYWSLKGFNTMGKFGKQKREFALYDMLDSNKIIGNRVCGNHGFGIDLDDGSNNYVIMDNFCCGVGIKLREGFFRKVKDNVLLGAPMDLHVSFWGNDDEVCGNTIICNKAFRIIMPNKGSNTKIEGNTIINNKATLGSYVSHDKNKFLHIDNKNELKNLIDKFLVKDFGVPSAEKPKISLETQSYNERRIKKCGARLSTMNEEKRSLSGAPNLDGIYVDKVSIFGLLAKFKLKRGDVISAINGQTCAWIDVDKLPSCKNLTVIRNQLIVELSR